MARSAAVWCSLVALTAMPAMGVTHVTLEDFEKADRPHTVWVVNIPNENAAVELSTASPHSGSRCLKAHYHFVETGGFQYLGIPNKVRILAPINHLRFWLRGDHSGCTYGVQVTDVSGETHQFGTNTGQGGRIDFDGWRETVIDLGEKHETWGGDKNGRIDYPITGITLTVAQPMVSGKQRAVESDLAFDDITADTDRIPEEVLGVQIAVTSPPYCSDVKGDTRIAVEAPGLSAVTARCWKPGGKWGADSTVATIPLDAKGHGSFVLPANAYPHGPLTVRISGQKGTARDTCCLQLYNRGGTAWKAGAPTSAPPAARGMKLVFADDFTGPLSISSTDAKATYYDHKPPNGWQDFSAHPFTSHGAPGDPFAQTDTYLRIRTSDRAHSAGLISSLKNDGSGIKVTAPCYFECRFLGPNAIGTWPAFWLMTDYMTDYKTAGANGPCDELDVIEAYGGEGAGSPNAHDTYMITPHCWNQGDEGKALEKKAFEALHNPCRMGAFGIPSTWYDTFHTYGCKVTETDTIYYCDDVEVGRHATPPISKQKPLFFMINLATGGGWPVDLSRYGGVADMYVDYVRVYAGTSTGPAR